jgi:hypothetical protein
MDLSEIFDGLCQRMLFGFKDGSRFARLPTHAIGPHERDTWRLSVLVRERITPR